MQHPAALLIRAVVELLPGIVVGPIDNRFVFGPVPQYAVRDAVEVIQHGVTPVLVAVVELLVIHGKSLVQPQVAPVLARHVVAEPLMNQLVRHEALARTNVLRLIGKKRPRRENRQRGVLHPPSKILTRRLVIFVPRIRYADLFLVERQHIRGVLK